LPPLSPDTEQAYPLRRRAIAPRLIIAAAGVAAALLLVRLRPYRVAVTGPSMAPALEPGDFLVAARGLRPGRGSLVVVEHPGRPGFEIVKRVERAPGDLAAGRVLGPGKYWLTGDDPGQSTDSRTMGPIDASRIRGVVVARYWPADRLTVFGWEGRSQEGRAAPRPG
jgi:signal peptidase I